MLVSDQFVLPFAVKSDGRGEVFSVEAEMAAVFALSELERKSGGLANNLEKVVYILKVGYPLWFIVRGNFTYVFDGLNLTQHNWRYCEVLPLEGGVKFEDFEGSFRIREEYLKFLSSYPENLGQVQNYEALFCEGLIADHVFLEELGSYRREVIEKYGQSMGLFLPVLDEKKVLSTVSHIEALQLSFREKIEELGKLSVLVSNTTQRYLEGFNFEFKSVVEEVEAKIKAQKEIITPKIEKLTFNYKKQVERLEKSVDKEQQPLERCKSRIEKSLKKTESNMDRYMKQVKIQSQRGNKRSEESLKKKLRKEKQTLEELQIQQKKVKTQLETLREQKTRELSTLKGEFDSEVQIIRQPIIALEVGRDKKLEGLQEESLKLEKLTQHVLENLSQLVTEGEKNVTDMKLLGLKTDYTLLKNNSIVYVPFYITAYSRTNSKDKRYFVLSPSQVGSLGFSSKLRGFLGRAKIKNLFNNRFKAISLLGEKMQTMAAVSNAEFETQIEELLLQKNNLLDRKTQLKEGLFLLKEEGWLSETEHQTILATIYT